MSGLKDLTLGQATAFLDELPSKLGLANYNDAFNKELIKRKLAILELSEHHRGKYNYTILHFAARCGHFSAVKFLLDLGYDPKVTAEGASLLHLAARHSGIDINMIRFLIDLDLDPNIMDNYGDTALHDAAYGGNYRLIQIFIEEYGVSPHQKNNALQDILYWAERGGNQETIKLCSDNEFLTQLYANYLTPYIKRIIPPYLTHFKEGQELITSYAVPLSVEEQTILEESIKKLKEERLVVLKPLIEFCKHYAAGDESRSVLKQLLAKKTLDLRDIEEDIELLLNKEELRGAPHLYPLLLCRLNIAQYTGNPPKNLPSDLRELIQHQKMPELQQAYARLQAAQVRQEQLHTKLNASYERLGQSYEKLQRSHKELQQAHLSLKGEYEVLQGAHNVVSNSHRTLQASYQQLQVSSYFQLNCLYTCALIGAAMMLAAGIALLCLTSGAGFIITGATLVGLGTITAGFALHGFFTNKHPEERQRQALELNDQACCY